MVQLTSYLKVEISRSVPILSSVTQTHSILLLLHYQHVGFQYLCLRLDMLRLLLWLQISCPLSSIASIKEEEGCSPTNSLSISVNFGQEAKAFWEGMQQTTHWLKLRHMATSLHCRGKCNCHYWFRSFAVVTLGCHIRIPQTRWHKQQKFISHSPGG